MPKIRGIKPETWTDEKFVELTPLARLLFIGLWTYACDNGHLEDKPKQIKMRLLPADDCSANVLLDELAHLGLIERADGWITVVNMREHQKADKRWFVACDRPGCKEDAPEKPTSKRAARGDSPAQPRSDHHEATTSARRGLVVASPEPRGGHVADVGVDVDGDVDGDLIVKEASCRPPVGGRREAGITRQDVDRLCRRLAEAIEANGSKRPSINKQWRDAARLMLDRDGRTEAEVNAAIDWCQHGESDRARFWRSNVLSMPKLREKFDQMRLQAQQEAPVRHISRAEGWIALAHNLDQPQPSHGQIGHAR